MDGNAAQSVQGREAVFQAARKIAPLAMGYIPVGMAFGVLAQKAGLSLVNTVLMSVLVYAGSAQLIAVGMFAAGMPPLSIVLTTFVVNLRHLLMSAAMTPHLRKWGPFRMAAFCYELTDETFALHSMRFGRGDRDMRQTFLINAMAQTVWVLSSWAGALAGSGVPDVEPLALDYALPAMFIGLLAMQAENGLKWLTAGFTGLVAIALVQAGLDQWSVIMATVIGATFGAGVETWTRK
ncbi:AzlC family ABC transporter permease [Salidesulfovibrio brasiliensis]|uniref:AzlC family ABC transporter permease n=1 Tax=Salidesulfovibrio brasiliensis TaxID=221711 RepID=UPI0006D29DBD|nr:AzlC family ABC transporter permease [Salidesulfovibrio brasiliensis]